MSHKKKGGPKFKLGCDFEFKLKLGSHLGLELDLCPLFAPLPRVQAQAQAHPPLPTELESKTKKPKNGSTYLAFED
jgi:hypothetical protein